MIVSTPQDLALIDATRAIDLFDKAGVPVIGLVENMAGYACPHCGEISDPFGQGGAEATAQRLGLPFLGRVPLAIDIRTASDAGRPPAATRTTRSSPPSPPASRSGSPHTNAPARVTHTPVTPASSRGPASSSNLADQRDPGSRPG